MTETTRRALIAQTIRTLRAEYIVDKYAPSYFEINNGLCDEFGEEVVARLSSEDRKGIFTVEGANFENEDGRWDSALLRKFWKMAPPALLTWRDLNAIPFGCHIWVTDGMLHYDAEQPDGVANFFDLPIFRRCIITHLRTKGIPCHDVITEDVVPAPVCGVPNPKLSTEDIA